MLSEQQTVTLCQTLINIFSVCAYISGPDEISVDGVTFTEGKAVGARKTSAERLEAGHATTSSGAEILPATAKWPKNIHMLPSIPSPIAMTSKTTRRKLEPSQAPPAARNTSIRSP